MPKYQLYGPTEAPTLAPMDIAKHKLQQRTVKTKLNNLALNTWAKVLLSVFVIAGAHIH